MNARERKLLIIVGSVVALMVVAFAIRAIVVKPVRELDKRNGSLRVAISKAEENRRKFFAAEDKVKRFTARTLADSVDQASALSGEWLTRQLTQLGLKESEFTRLPSGVRKLRGASETGWSVQGQGPVKNVVDLLYALGNTPQLQRVESLAVGQGDAPGILKVRFRLLTLVIDPAPEVTRTQIVAKVDLSATNRAALNVIAQRDLLRPYVKRPPPAVVKNPDSGSPPAGKSAPGPESFRVVSLSEWEGRPEVHVRDTINEKTRRYAPGDELSGGRIVMIDYRPLPLPGRAPLLSSSRVVLQIKDEFWAIDRGNTLAEKRLLTKNDLPPELARRKE